MTNPDVLANWKATYKLIRERDALPWWAWIRYDRLTRKIRAMMVKVNDDDAAGR